MHKENLKGDISIDWKRILKLILIKYDAKLWAGFSGLNIGPSGGILSKVK
jgi:hypothetical protein